VAASLSVLLIAAFGVDSLISAETLPWTCLSVGKGMQGHAGACRGMQGHRGGFQHLRFPMRFNELKLANYIIVDFLNLPIHLLVILFSLDIDLSVGRFFRLHGGNC
jgi:hypothetical protein